MKYRAYFTNGIIMECNDLKTMYYNAEFERRYYLHYETGECHYTIIQVSTEKVIFFK